MLLWLFTLFLPCISSTFIDKYDSPINYDLVYQSNLFVFQSNSLRFSSALQDRYHLFNIGYEYSMYPCFKLCNKIPGCLGIFKLTSSCIGLSYLGEHSQTTLLNSESYKKIVDFSILSSLSCKDRCGLSKHFTDYKTICWCDAKCLFFNDCCEDYNYICIDHCLTNNGGCSQLCKTNEFGGVNCDCNSEYFLGNDLTTCHHENSIVGRIYDNIHELHLRDVSIYISNNNKTNITLKPNFHGEFMIHNLSDGNYTIEQLIHGNCTKIKPTSNEINITLPTNREYDFYNFCGLNCRCDRNYYLSNCNFKTGYGTCNSCDQCESTHNTIQNCTNISNTICKLITSTQTTTETSTLTSSATSTLTISATSTLTTSATSTLTTSATSTLTTSATSTLTTSATSTLTSSATSTLTTSATSTLTITSLTTQTTTLTTTPTITYKILNNQDSNKSLSINYQTITIVLSIVSGLILILISIFFIKRNKRSYTINEENKIYNNNTHTISSDNYNNPVFDLNEPINQSLYQDVEFQEPTNEYMDVAPSEE